MTTTKTSPLLRVPEVARRLRMSERFVLDEIRRSALPASKYGGTWHVYTHDLDAYVEARRNVEPAARTG